MKHCKDHVWELVKYIGDLAVYAKCKCGYHYNCSVSYRNKSGYLSLIQIPSEFRPYCPSCGARKKWISEQVVHSNMDIREIKGYGRIKDMSRSFIDDNGDPINI